MAGLYFGEKTLPSMQCGRDVFTASATIAGRRAIMDERLIDFVNYVRAHPGIASTAVAEHFGVGVRTVRNWLHETNEALGDTAEITSDRGSYTLAMHSRRRFERLVSVGNSIWSRTPSTSDRRVAVALLTKRRL